jgi:acetyltransferase-like isoleucine patch superfamily enzyme
MVLRKALYRSLFLAIGRGTILGPYVTVRCPRRISLGERNFIDAQGVLDAKGTRSGIVTGNLVLVGHSTVLSCSDATITIGSDVSIGAQCTIRAGLGPITIGSSVTIGSQSVVISGNPDYKRLDVPMKRQLGSGKGVEIGDDVWIGVGARIIDGVTIGSGSVVGAGAVVIRDLPEYSIAAGVPAEVMGTRRG